MGNAKTTVIDSILLSKMLINGCNNLKKNESAVNNMNVFPVPDGDTGTNMYLTMQGGSSVLPEKDTSIGNFLKTYSKKILFSARGNSGIILSQYLKGFSQFAQDFSEMSANDMRDAFGFAVGIAYGSVITPTEGTMLTVMREAAESAKNINFECFQDFFCFYLEKMIVSLEHTPDLLPCLREANVLDSGGMGLVKIFEGMNDALSGIFYEGTGSEANQKQVDYSYSAGDDLEKFGYCTDFTVNLKEEFCAPGNFNMDGILEKLKSFGDSIVTFREDNCVKIHIHTKKPGDVLNFAQCFGDFISIKIENMSLQSKNAEIGMSPVKKKYGIVAAAKGKGITEYFKSLGVDAVIDGGQTDNPPVEAFVDAFKKINSENIICLPNNGNTVLSATQAAKIYSEKDVFVIPTKEITEGFAAISVLNPADSIENIVSDMTYAASNVITGAVSAASRTCIINGVSVKKDDYIGFSDDVIYSSGTNLTEVTCSLLEKLNENEDAQVITLYYGNNLSEEDTAPVIDFLNEKYPFLETGAVNGGQDTYFYLISVE